MHLTSTRALRELAARSNVRLTIRGACMSPQLIEGATISVRRRRLYLPGDVIVFRTPAGALAAHRILGWRPAGLVTRGDWCVTHDAPIRRHMIIGAVHTSVPLRVRFRALTGFAGLIVQRLMR